MVKKKIFCYTCLIIGLLLSCNHPEKIPHGILPEDQMVNLLADIHIAESAALNKTAGGDAAIQFAIDHDSFVLKQKGVSLPVFKKSLEYYMKDPKHMDQMYAEVITLLSKKQSEILH